jgi:retrograde regulation protein 2
LTYTLRFEQPAVMVYRSSISLYDAQFDDRTGAQIPIPKDVIDAVCHALRRFQIICTDFKVEHDQIHVLATEAARVAKNSAQLLSSIKATTGLDVKLLDKEEEGNIGALGIASGFMAMEGLVMDLGGGSTQISWIVSQNGSIRTSPRGSFSFPYGAAALTKKLEELRAGKDKAEAKEAVSEFRKEMIGNFRHAYENLEIPVRRRLPWLGVPSPLSGSDGQAPLPNLDHQRLQGRPRRVSGYGKGQRDC